MAYEPTTWQNGDVVTAEKMNKIEEGIAEAGTDDRFYIVHINSEYTDSDGWEFATVETAGQIWNAVVSGKILQATPFIRSISGSSPIQYNCSCIANVLKYADDGYELYASYIDAVGTPAAQYFGSLSSDNVFSTRTPYE